MLRLIHRAVNSALVPLGWLTAHVHALPGLGLQARCARLGMRVLLRGRRRVGLNWISHLLFSPIVLTRYFEFDFAWRALSGLKIERYLDVSSPFMFPVLLAHERPTLDADLINPDAHDLPITRAIVAGAGLEARCHLHADLIERVDLPANHYDAITCLSVLEHIPDDRAALIRMWSLLRPGGTLVLTLPCARDAHRLFTNLDHYGLLGDGGDGFTFLEYVYDSAQLEERLFVVTGKPAACEVYGERQAGTLRRELVRRWSGGAWRFWAEPLWMGRHFTHFDAIEALPGEGVVVMSFVKPG
ncbi:MAG: class I SAM-dependent methyltransferase [Thermoflexales bacterium]|nr:class I SAM-dependent methyltransferase [Thermoflexales bacterium]